MKIKNYVRPESLEEAYELKQKRSNRLAGGMLWLRQGKETIQTIIDLSGLGLDTIEETEDEFRIGCMVTLRQLELADGLNRYADGCVCQAVKSIVGVQFRNLATVGGSIWGRYGFSDVLTIFLAMDTWVELYKAGRIPLEEFAERKKDNDILVRLIVKKRPQRTVYGAYRNTRTDFPVLTCAIGLTKESGIVALGARPGRAKCWPLPEKICRILWGTGSVSLQGSSETERRVSGELTETEHRAVGELAETEHRVAGELTETECRTTGELAETERRTTGELAEAECRTTGESAEAMGAEEPAEIKETATGDEVREKLVQEAAAAMAAKIPVGSNLRAGAEYRRHLAEVLIRRGLMELSNGAEGKGVGQA